jgi:membrane protease YdiL (CAAX protease family)
LYVAATLVLGSLAAPPLHALARSLGDAWNLEVLQRMPFSRTFNRALMLAALACIWPLLRGGNPGGQRNADWRRHLAIGVAISTVGLSLVCAVLFALGWARLRVPFPFLAIPGAAVTAIAVALLEEWFFRGALLTLFRRHGSDRLALVVVTSVFALVHFLRPAHYAAQISRPQWWSGFQVLPHLFHRFGDPRDIIGGLATLFLFGWILGVATLRTRSLVLAMALHGGWVFALRSMTGTTERGPGSVWLSRDLQSGWVPLLLLGATLWLVQRLFRPTSFGKSPL